ncbi:hypothetical protein ACFY2H_06975 [Streptomyces griseofuscus]
MPALIYLLGFTPASIRARIRTVTLFAHCDVLAALVCGGEVGEAGAGEGT